MGQDAFMELLSSMVEIFLCKTYLLLIAGSCLGLKVTVPSHTVHGIRGQALYLPVHYGFHTPASDIQIIWLFERSHTMPKYLLGSVNKSVVPDLEYQHKFTMVPPNASLLINPLQFADEGNYIVKVNIQGNGTLSSSQKIQVTVDDPVMKPVVQSHPASGAVEYVGNITLTCQVEGGTRLVYQWRKNGKPVCISSSHSFSPQNNTLWIVPVTKEDIGNYSCLVSNPVSEMESDIIMPTIYYGPYGLQVNSDKGLKVGEVFTVDLGEAVLFDCSADSYPPNTYSWIRRSDNTTHVIKHGPRLEVASEKVAQKTTDYVCCAYNNITGKQDETRFTIIITSIGLEKLAQKGKSLSPLASITGISLFLIISMCLLFLWKKYQPYKAIKQKLEGRPESEYRKAQTFSGHEDALGDFGIYEFVTFPDASGVLRMPSRSIPVSDGVTRPDFHGTIYEVIQHMPVQQQDHEE
ncbi:HEPACAM family member 2 isoform X1 [Meriones unguiculatus]|uniref:HEPACAM family member 2 isoform X2 n=1 Tax=Meriones unguiculatus TaxID=10047 RepID=UPI000B4EDC51|nr:HEPACAM family member 2 isoform X2 [Meriones unguiculatus]XP_021483200.1 HEPACAM family member 2 isoform X1 [Meriones unguiculatus]